MIRGSLFALLIAVLICIGIFAYWTASVTRKKQDQVMADFKRVEGSLKIPADSTRRNHQQLPDVTLAMLSSGIIQTIDSMKSELVVLSKQKDSNSTSFSYPNKMRVLALKQKLAAYNNFIREYFADKKTISSRDFVNMEDVPFGKSKPVPWEVFYFENTNIFGILTELNHTGSQVYKLQYKATH